MRALFGFDAFSPAEVAARIEAIGVAKARLPALSTLMLGVLAGVFIGFGALAFMLVNGDASLGFAARQGLGGMAFSLGLVLVVVAGAELFTGNNLLAIAWADRRISSAEVLRNWALAGTGNLLGALGLAALVVAAGHTGLNQGRLAEHYIRVAQAKCELPFATAFFRGVLCNVLVCLAVWMATAGRSVIDKVVAIVLPVAAFVAAGFEHSIANFYLIPLAMMLQASGEYAALGDAIGWRGLVSNLVPVILGNLVGGSVLVGLVYHVIYQRAGHGAVRKAPAGGVRESAGATRASSPPTAAPAQPPGRSAGR